MLKSQKNSGFILIEVIFTLFIATLTITLIGYVMNTGLHQEQATSCWLNQAANQLMQLHQYSAHTQQVPPSLSQQYQVERLMDVVPQQVELSCKHKQEVIQIEDKHMQKVRFSPH